MIVDRVLRVYLTVRADPGDDRANPAQGPPGRKPGPTDADTGPVHPCSKPGGQGSDGPSLLPRQQVRNGRFLVCRRWCLSFVHRISSSIRHLAF